MPASHYYASKKVFLTMLLFVVVVAMAGVLVGADKHSTKAQTSKTASAKKATSQFANATFKDGMYSGTGSYNSPSGRESITINVTLASNVISATSATSNDNDPTSQLYQGLFTKNYAAQVVGKKINQVSLSRVAGSSLTPIGFNEAIQKIEASAKA